MSDPTPAAPATSDAPVEAVTDPGPDAVAAPAAELPGPLLPPDYRPLIDEGWHEQACWSALAGQLKQRVDDGRRWAAVLSVLGAGLVTAAAQLKGGAPEAADMARAAAAAAGPQAAASVAELATAAASVAGNAAHAATGAASAAAGAAAGSPVLAIAGVLSLLAGGVLALAPLIVQRFASPTQVSAWTRARAVSEAWKTQLYRLLVASSQPEAAPAAAAEYVRRTEAARKTVADLEPQAAAQHPATKARPSTLSLDDYIAQRLMDQCNHYYGPAAQREAAKAQRLRAWSAGLGSLAAALTWASGPLTTQLPALGAWAGTLAGWLPGLAPWATVATTAAMAVVAHLAAARHETQANVYRATAQRLRGVHKLWSVSPSRYSAAEAAALVDEVETAITTENGAWLADWGKGSEAP